ncbi:nicastrin [Chloropicon primus]|uniref:Nicastrin n=1 Tax=Chloropicon primus TaxID=1764295 RepID=A0A5B8MSI5_9CHLO|nr:nicastrin [Chloropicon primus]UPR01567.1 nicastrin [Chloropicon primus]|mmetsp:Transcript_11063/g.30931  ORF Transcript_11063/g.30931 Transcript_11063/m.30931 type:complete len:687 (-) Transcript_11063:1293-3353(-)|eukprot:QDZ22350.1 nicastrin [Chloropicon primus]
MSSLLLLVLCVLALAADPGFGLRQSESGLPTSPNDLQNRIVTEFTTASACVLLLHTKGQSGCYGRTSKAPLRYYADYAGKEEPVVLVVEEEEVPHFLENLVEEGSPLAKGVRGALIIRRGDGLGRPSSFSPEERFPDGNFAPYDDKTYAWNPNGLDLLRTGKAMPPLYALSVEESEAFREMVDWNKNEGYSYPQYVADLTTEMLAAEEANSFECLDKSTCLPIGGYTVASTLPPSAAASSPGQDCVLVLAQVGNSNIFHGLNKGAEASISGLVAAAAAYEAVARAVKSSGEAPKRRLAFGLIGSEGYGLAGSRRLAHNLKNESYSLGGCSRKDISYIVEVGPVGLAAAKDSSKEYYLHMTPEAEQDNATVFDIFKTAAAGVEGAVDVEKPTGTPGIPPSSLMSFQNPNSDGKSIPGLVLTDYDQRISNRYLSSYMDDATNVDISSVYSASNLLSRALYMLASDSSADSIKIDGDLLNSTVHAMSDCLLTSKPGLQCPLVQQIADSSLTQASFYPGVVSYQVQNDQSPNDKTDLMRFLWGFLATRSEGLEDVKKIAGAPHCDFPSGKRKCESEQEVCVRWKSAEKGANGRCVAASVQYIPAWSHHLAYKVNKDGYGKWGVDGTVDTVSDEIWTESYWPPDSPSALVYLSEGFLYECVMFFVGLGLTLSWFWAMKKANTKIDKEMKQW